MSRASTLLEKASESTPATMRATREFWLSFNDYLNDKTHPDSIMGRKPAGAVHLMRRNNPKDFTVETNKLGYDYWHVPKGSTLSLTSPTSRGYAMYTVSDGFEVDIAPAIIAKMIRDRYVTVGN